MKQYFSLFVKGFSMGAANVIPGVSGGTIALITGIYNELISTLKSFNLKALKLLFKFKFKEFFNQINLAFLIVLFAGAITGIVSLGKFFKWVIELERDFNGNVIKHGYEPVLFALFFGLILASVYYVGVTIKKWNFSTIISGLIGCIIAVLLVLVKPSSESDDYLYLFLCGIVAMSSMLLPGLSGSFVLILMGNYYLIMIDSVQNFDIKILGVVCIGAVVGFVILSHLISYLLQKHEDVTLSSLTGFIFGSLVTIWPWKTILREEIVKGDKIKEVIVGYENWFFPEFSSFDLLLILFVFIGFLMVFGFERLGNYLKSKTVKN
jgi:putative membrane protein